MRRGKWWWALAAALLITLLPAAPAQADTSFITKSSGVPTGYTTLTVVDEATAKVLEPKLRNSSAGIAPSALCAQPSYVQVFDKATGQRLITVAPGNTINVHAFTLLRHQGVVYPGTRAIFTYGWSGVPVFEFWTTFAEGNCVIREEPNTLSAQNFPVGNLVSVSVCFIPWELGQVVCGPLGFINRFF